MEGHALRKARRLAALSSGVAATVRELYGNKIADVDICPPGLNATKSPRSLSKTRDVSILFVGRLEPRKGASIFIDALRDVLRSNDRVAVNVVGADSPTAPNGLTHQEYARRVLGPLSARVRFHGYVSVTDLASFWAAADIFVAPSTYESFGLVYLEAMRHGIPIVAAAVPGVDEVVDPSCGVLVPPRDAQRLAAAILNLVHDPNRRSVLGQGASDRLRRHFSEDRMVQTTIDTYRRAIGEE
jgi:glycosyltransferase involved in cell wall biosynthesis